MALFSAPESIHSHRVRFVLAEKGINVEIVDVDSTSPPEDLIDLNPYQSIPTLVDRDLVLYDVSVITEYLDERYPHPPLMPVDPVSRARLRLAKYQLMHDWFPCIERIENGDSNEKEAARLELIENLVRTDEAFSAAKFFLSDELTLVDCELGPLLWRLEYYGVTIPDQAKGVLAYCERLFELDSFQESLSDQERELRL